MEVCGVRKKEEYHQWGWRVSMFLPQVGRAWEVGKAFPPPSATFPELKKIQTHQEESLLSLPLLQFIIFNYVPHFCWQKLRGTMAATTILRAIETKGRRSGEKNWVHASIFFSHLLPPPSIFKHKNLSAWTLCHFQFPNWWGNIIVSLFALHNTPAKQSTFWCTVKGNKDKHFIVTFVYLNKSLSFTNKTWSTNTLRFPFKPLLQKNPF